MVSNSLPFFVYIILFAWYVIVLAQAFMAYGTAYRATKANGDNGVALFGWMIVYMLAAYIPGLGYYFWRKSKREVKPKTEQ